MKINFIVPHFSVPIPFSGGLQLFVNGKIQEKENAALGKGRQRVKEIMKKKYLCNPFRDCL
ncbi:hypothetical protein CLOSTMETH_02400 [[Clostridium] methylpentosum DSM 5476]|uniref:Uncharacterized protein n=1 Tax=[Clostridium] methylpentosum DSM 5476 TaxID=537013 RepID=C0EEW1_9FIRM|nr:hypothetical protein CLOSTMETH_02400 [[Clostridium] methylpentosum DSM 5476]